LRADAGSASKTGGLARMLSAQFRLRDRPHVRAYMGAVDGLCRQAEGACAGRLRHHAKMARGSWTAARTEMATLVAIGRHFGTVRTGPEIPGSSGRADMGFAHGGKEIYVGVCSHVWHYAVAALPKAGITTEEGVEIFGRAGAGNLREAGVPTVCVIGLDGLQAGAGVTRTREFCEAARKVMPGDSDIVVVLHGVEAASLRGGHVVKPSGIATALRRAILEALPESVARLGP